MPVIGADDYLNFQRNLISSRQATEQARATQRGQDLEAQQAQARLAQQESQFGRTEDRLTAAAQAQQSQFAANFSMALQKLAFEEKVNDQRRAYEQQTLQLERDRLKIAEENQRMQQELHMSQLKKAQLENDLLSRQVADYQQADKDVAELGTAYAAAQAAGQPGEDGTVDEAAKLQAQYGLLQKFTQANPMAVKRFQEGLGTGVDALFSDQLGELKIKDIKATIALKAAQAQNLVAAPGGPVAPGTKEEIDRLNWLDKQGDQLNKEFGAITVAGLGTFTTPDDVRKSRDAFFAQDWKENSVVLEQVRLISSVVQDPDITKLMLDPAIALTKGAELEQKLEAAVKQVGDDKAREREAALRAVDDLGRTRQRVSAKAALFNLAEGITQRRELQVRTTLSRALDKFRGDPDGLFKAKSEASSTLEAGGTALNSVFADQTMLKLVESFRAMPNPLAPEWRTLAATMVNRMEKIGITDPATQKYILDLIRGTHPSARATISEG